MVRHHVKAGGIAALPVVVEKNAPVEFWQWKPGDTMQRSFWNIPVPAERRVVIPNALLVPLVGYDAAGYRLGYGGGYYDRTLAATAPRPLVRRRRLRRSRGRDDSPAAPRRADGHDRDRAARAPRANLALSGRRLRPTTRVRRQLTGAHALLRRQSRAITRVLRDRRLRIPRARPHSNRCV